MRVSKRKAVYIPVDIWEVLEEDALKNYRGVTHELTTILLEHYGTRVSTGNNKNSGKQTSTINTDDGVF